MRSTVSAMNGCQCRIPTYTGHAGPSASWSARAWASVRSRMGERPPMRAYRSLISATSSGAVARPPRTSRRDGSTSATLPGPPYAISSPAPPPPAPPLPPPPPSAAMYPVHDALQRLDRRLRKYAVPEVEDVARAARRPAEHVTDSLLELGERREQRRRIEVPLNRPLGTDALPRDVEGNAPVHPDDVAARAREVGEEHGGVGPEMDHGDARRAGQLERPLTVGKHVRRIIRRRQAADPAVEQLQCPRAGARLGGEVGADQLRDPQHQLVPGSGLGVHEPLGQGEAARRAALDGIARERERRAGEADERDVRGKPA